MGARRLPINTSPIRQIFRREISSEGNIQYLCPVCGKRYSATTTSQKLVKHYAVHGIPEDVAGTSEEDKIYPLRVLNFLVSCRLPLSIVEKRSFRALLPGKEPMSNKRMKKILDEECRILRDRIFFRREVATPASLVLDGWLRYGHHVYSIGVKIESKYYLYGQLSTEGKQDASWLKTMVTTIIEYLRDRNIIIASVVSDNASVLGAAFTSIPGVVHHRCGAHCMNLLLHRYIKQFHIEDRARLFVQELTRLKPKTRIVYYVETRWYSMHAHLESLKFCYLEYGEKYHAQVDYITNVLLYIGMMNKCLGALESDTCTVFDEVVSINDMCRSFSELSTEESAYILSTFKELYMNYFDRKGILRVAGYLNPDTKEGTRKTFGGTESIFYCALDLARKWNLNLTLEALEEYDKIDRDFFEGSGCPKMLWERAAETSKNPNFQKLHEFVKILQSISTSEAYIERVFSQERLIWSYTRNRLSLQTVDNLVFLHANIKMWREMRKLFE